MPRRACIAKQTEKVIDHRLCVTGAGFQGNTGVNVGKKKKKKKKKNGGGGGGEGAGPTPHPLQAHKKEKKKKKKKRKKKKTPLARPAKLVYLAPRVPTLPSPVTWHHASSRLRASCPR